MTGPPAETRLHNSAKPLKRVRRVEQSGGEDGQFKPRGLWYGIGDAWLEWCREEMPGWIHAHTYELVLRPGARVLVLDSPEAILRFHREYASGGCYSYPDWQRVADEHDGLEIAPYQWSLRHELMWYYSWDCASGCIWRPRAIANLREVPSPDVVDVGA